MSNIKKKAVILLSGGIDSTTTAAVALNEGFQLCSLTFSYGQRHSIEIDRAKKIADFLKIHNNIIIEIPFEIFASSALSIESNIRVPINRDIETSEIPSTYVPARNILFLSYALSYAETINSKDIFIGANAVDYSGYPDCRPDFFKAYEYMANIGTKTGIEGDMFKIHTPLINMRKAEIIKTGIDLGIDYSMTHSCYSPSEEGLACGECDSCLIRRKGFDEAKITDPTEYRTK